MFLCLKRVVKAYLNWYWMFNVIFFNYLLLFFYMGKEICEGKLWFFFFFYSKKSYTQHKGLQRQNCNSDETLVPSKELSSNKQLSPPNYKHQKKHSDETLVLDFYNTLKSNQKKKKQKPQDKFLTIFIKSAASRDRSSISPAAAYALIILRQSPSKTTLFRPFLHCKFHRSW